MTFSTMVFTRLPKGELLKFQADEISSYEQAIDMVKERTGAPRALCLVSAHLESIKHPVPETIAA
jgi:hypothetical protein